ncbi:hypothetical protein [Alkalicoccus urumqiensis]|uniref:Uncharacterized protein n=1 Tax=Alkalicoccus urumqiensis TaxID=1548213 RepID=A0A2P6MEG7_ALKUR|nr:hypothetical protein [Alkalicoccus urumqiensis]PRO64679.1 hypothetical protein C6I21_13310 [Alkalicoccus urumqiensis]
MLKEESGYALLIVLLTIVLVGIAAVPLINQTLTSAQQVEVVKAQAKADEMRTYGERYFQQRTAVSIEESIRTFEAALWEEEERRIGSRDLEDLYAYLRNSLQDEYSRFTAADPLGITPASDGEGAAAVIPEAVTLDTSEDGAGIQIRYESIGEAGGRESREAQLLEFSFQLDGGGNSEPGRVEEVAERNLDSDRFREEGGSVFNEKDINQNDDFPSGDVLFTDGVTLKKGAGEKTITGDLFAEGKIELKQRSVLRIEDYFYHVDPKNGKDNLQTQRPDRESFIVVGKDMVTETITLQQQARVCVNGFVYIKNGNRIQKHLAENDEENTGSPEHEELNKVSSCSVENVESEWEQGAINYAGITTSSGGGGGSQPITSTSGWILRSGNSQ